MINDEEEVIVVKVVAGGRWLGLGDTNVEILNSDCDQKQRRKIEERENERLNLRERFES